MGDEAAPLFFILLRPSGVDGLHLGCTHFGVVPEKFSLNGVRQAIKLAKHMFRCNSPFGELVFCTLQRPRDLVEWAARNDALVRL